MVGGEVQAMKRGGARRLQHFLHSALAKDVNLARAKLAFARADGEKGLDGVVGKAARLWAANVSTAVFAGRGSMSMAGQGSASYLI